MRDTTGDRYQVRDEPPSDMHPSQAWYVEDTHRKARVSDHPTLSRVTAQDDADRRNITGMVKDYEADPRPYGDRYAEAEENYRADV